MLEEEKMYRC